jgi:hypothetical protein
MQAAVSAFQVHVLPNAGSMFDSFLKSWLSG